MRAHAHRLFTFDTRILAWAAAGILLSGAAGLLVAAEPAAAFDVSVIGVCAALIAWRPYAALLFLLFVRAGFATSPSSTILDFLTLGAGGIALALCARSLPGRRVMLPLLAFLLVALPSVPLLPSWDEGYKETHLRLPILGEPYARAPSNELYEFVRLAAAFVAFAWAAWAVRTPRQLDRIVAAVVASAAYPIVMGLYELATGQTQERAAGFPSVDGLFSHPNGFAAYLLVVLTLAVVAFIEARSLAARIGIALVLSGGIVCLYYTYTRAAWIGFAVAIVLLGTLRYRRLILAGVLGVLLAIIFAPAAAQKTEQRFDDLSSDSRAHSQNSWSWRREQWSEMVPYGLERPVFGRGFGSYARNTVAVYGTEDPDFATKPRRAHGPLGFGAHNDYVKALVETGVVGLTLWVLTLLGLISVGARARRVRGVEAWGSAMFALAVALALLSVADNVQAAAVDVTYAFGLGGAVAGAALRPRPRPQEAQVAPAAREGPPTQGPAPPEAASPEPTSSPAPERAPAAVRRPGIRARLGAVLRRRR